MATIHNHGGRIYIEMMESLTNLESNLSSDIYGYAGRKSRWNKNFRTGYALCGINRTLRWYYSADLITVDDYCELYLDDCFRGDDDEL